MSYDTLNCSNCLSLCAFPLFFLFLQHMHFSRLALYISAAVAVLPATVNAADCSGMELTETTLWLFCLARLDAKMTLVAAGVDILYPKEGSKIIKSEQETIYLIVGKDQRLKQLRDKWKIKVAGVQATRSKTQSWRKYIYLVEVHRMQRSCERCKTRMKSLARLRFYKRISIGWKAVNRSISSSGRVRFLNLKIARSGLMDASPLCRIVVNQDGQQCSYESPRFQIL